MTVPSNHVAAFDGLRGAAVLAVALFHGFPQHAPGGFLGVDVFFALSGFLITNVVLGEWARRGGSFDFVRFGRRRLLRLGPALVLLLLADLGFALATKANLLDHLIDEGLILSGAASWTLALGFDRPGLMAHTWSLAVEMQFYLLWPPILLFALRRGGLRGGLIAAVLLIACSAFWRAGLNLTGASALRGYEGADTRADGLLIGALLALLQAMKSAAVDRVLAHLAKLRWLAAGFLILIAARTEWTDRWLYLGGFDLLSLAAVIAILACLRDGATLWRRFLTWSPLAALGQISYGLYLWHFPLIWIIAGDPIAAKPSRVVLALSLALIASTGSYLLIERPILARRSGQPALA